MKYSRFFCLFFFVVALCAVNFALAGSGVPASVYQRMAGGQQDGVAPMPAQQPSLAVNPSQVVPSGTAQEYVLGTGDRIRLTVYGEEDLSGEYEVGSTGYVAMPLIGNVEAARRTIREFESAVREKLSNGYLHDPRVNVQVTNYRPFFILGEVSKPGGYPYVNGMTVLNAIALAGGYTYRADASGVLIIHAGDPQKKETPVREDEAILPGDILRVPERFF